MTAFGREKLLQAKEIAEAHGYALEGADRGRVAHRYFGVFVDGTWKAQGLAYRHHDVPVFIQRTQLTILGMLAEAKTLAGIVSQLPKAVEVFLESWEQLAGGDIPAVQLLVSTTVSRDPEEYAVETATALALRPLGEVGIHLHPGERVRSLLCHAKAPNADERGRTFPRLGPDDGFDATSYQRLLLDAALELLVPYGYDVKRLQGLLGRCPRP